MRNRRRRPQSAPDAAPAPEKPHAYGMRRDQITRLPALIVAQQALDIDEHPTWFMILVRPQTELRARLLLNSAKIPAWSPIESRYCHVRGSHNKRIPVYHPVVSQMIFIAPPGGNFWSILKKLRQMGIVSGVMGIDRAPIPVSQSSLKRFIARCGSPIALDAAQRDMATGGEFTNGDTVEVTSGAFEHHTGSVEDIDPSSGTATVTIEFLGGHRAAQIPLRSLRRRAA